MKTPGEIEYLLVEYGRRLDINCGAWHHVQINGLPEDSEAFQTALATKSLAHQAQVDLRNAALPEYRSLSELFSQFRLAP